MISRADELADPIAEGGSMAKVEEDIYERAARSGRHTPETLEWMRSKGIIPSTGPYTPLAPPVKPRPRWQAFLIRLFRIDYDDSSEEGDAIDDAVPRLLDIDEVFERAAQTGRYTSEELDFFRRKGIRPAWGRCEERGLPMKQRPAWLAFLLRTVLGPAR
jgi:hypothetical protein